MSAWYFREVSSVACDGLISPFTLHHSYFAFFARFHGATFALGGKFVADETDGGDGGPLDVVHERAHASVQEVHAEVRDGGDAETGGGRDECAGDVAGELVGRGVVPG